MKLARLSFLTGILVVSAAAAQDSNLIQNGDFETGLFSPWTLFVTPGGDISDASNTVPAVFQFDVNGDGTPSLAGALSVGRDRFHGQPGLQGGGVFQEFTLAEASSIQLSFDAAVWCHGPGGNLDGGTFELMLDGVVLDTWISGGILTGEISRSTLSSFVPDLAAGNHELRILIVRDFDQADNLYQFMDDVVAREVPEPNSLLLLSLVSMVAIARNWISRQVGKCN